MANLIYRNQANKIFIYNSAEEADNNPNICINDEHIEPKNTSSITIMTSGIPEYHIRIKNNFKNEDFVDAGTDAKGIATESAANGAKPHRTEVFSMNEDVLLKSIDDKLYLGTVVNIQNGKYLVKFDDNTEKWSCERGLKKLNSSINKTDNVDEPLCVVCKERSDTDVVEVCHKCSRGYHRQCMKNSPSNFSSPWCCDRCTANEIISISDSEDNESDVITTAVEKAKLPYDIASLKWDAQHRVNKEQTYCYCGDTGSWKNQMLQCCKCQQWFHQKCTSVFKGHFMHGDTFFVFCCTLCNGGSEFLHRTNFSWKTAVHLVLYELFVTSQQKYYSISKDVAPFIWERWDELNLPLAKFQTNEKLIKKIMQTVKQEAEFKTIGTKYKHKADLVCLRRNVPPGSSRICIPIRMEVNEKSLKKLSIKSYPLVDINAKFTNKPQVASIQEKSGGEKLSTERRRKTRHRLSSDDSRDVKQLCTADETSSDENSNKSALDWIIPKPSNFNGKNNPFHSQYKAPVKCKRSEKVLKKIQQATFETMPEIRIVRTIKRRLSAKDIALGSNESKRRKLMKRRKSSDVQIISEIIQPIHMPLPPYYRNGDSRDSNIDAKFVGNDKISRRQSRGKASNDSSRRSSFEAVSEIKDINLTEAVMSSPVKNKAINMLFGACNRIENGERFTILAKRLTFEGKQQLLLDWESPKGVGTSFDASIQ